MPREIIVAALLLYTTSPLAAQGGAESTREAAAVAAVAAEHVLSSKLAPSSRRVAVDPRSLDLSRRVHRSKGQPWSTDELNEITALTGMTVGRREEVRPCSGGGGAPLSCEFVGADAHLMVGRPEVSGDLATVFIELAERDESDWPGVVIFEVKLSRVSGEWAVVSTAGRAVT